MEIPVTAAGLWGGPRLLLNGALGAGFGMGAKYALTGLVSFGAFAAFRALTTPPRPVTLPK